MPRRRRGGMAKSRLPTCPSGVSPAINHMKKEYDFLRGEGGKVTEENKQKGRAMMTLPCL